jgi:hypothetical protein
MRAADCKKLAEKAFGLFDKLSTTSEEVVLIAVL